MRDRIRALRSKVGILLAYAEARLYLLITPKQWLSIYVKYEMQKIENKGYLSRALNALKTAFESINSRTISTNGWKNALVISIFLVILLGLLAFFMQSQLSHLFLIQFSNVDNISSIVSTAWQVSASVIGISFVLVIFLVEYLHKDRYESQIFPLFSQYTKFHFIVIFGLVTLASVGISLILLNITNIDAEGSSVILIYNTILQLTNLVLIIFLYGRTFEFIRPSKFLMILGSELDKHIKLSVVSELKKRLGNNYLHDICVKSKIQFALFQPADRTLESIDVKEKPNQSHAITDIHIGLIKRAAKLANINKIKNEDEYKIIWIAAIDNIINNKQKEIAYISNNINIRVKAHLALAVKLGHPSDRIPRAISENLQISKDELIEAIHNGNISTVDLLLNRYIFLIRSFLLAMRDYNVRFTLDMVEKDSRLFSDWYVLSQIERDYYTILEEALQSTNREIIHQAIDFPLDIIIIADEFRDHLAFRRFARFFPEIYRLAARLTKDKSLREFVYDRIWRYLQDYINLRIMPKLEDSNVSNEDVTTYRGYALEIASLFNALLKITVDLRDIDQFTTFGRAFNEMIQWLYEIPSDRVADLEHYLLHTEDKELRKNYENELFKKKNIDKLEEDFNQKRQLIWLGIGGWLAHLVSSNFISPESYKQWAGVVAKNFPDLEILYKTYQIDDNSRYVVSRDWMSWKLQELEENEKGTFVVGGFIDDDSWITNYYCQRGIELSQIDINSIQEITPSVDDRDIFEEVSKAAELFKTSEIWKETFDFPAGQIDEHIESFIQNHQRIKELLIKLKEDYIIGATIEQGLVLKFKFDVEESWRKTSILRNLMQKYGKYDHHPDAQAPDDLNAFGFSLFHPKKAFISQNRIHYQGAGTQLGRSLGMSDDKRLIELFIEYLPTIETKLDQLEETICHNLNRLRANGSNPILFYSRVHIDRLNQSKYYKPKWKIDLHELKDIDIFSGTFDGAPILNVRGLGEQNILLLDLNRIAKLVQYRVKMGSEYPLSIIISPIDEKMADKLISEQPSLLVDKDSGNRIEREKAIRDLLQEVHLQILEKFTLEEINSNEGLKIQLIK